MKRWNKLSNLQKNASLNRLDVTKAYLIILIIFDICAINISSILAMMLRFNGPLNIVPLDYFEPIMKMMIPNTIATLLIFAALRLYKSVWRFASVVELKFTAIAVVLSTVFNFLAYIVINVPIYRSYFIIYMVILCTLTCISRFAYRFMRLAYRRGGKAKSEEINTMIIGAGEACNVAIRELRTNDGLNFKVSCIVDDDEGKKGTYIQGVKVIGGRDAIHNAVAEYRIKEIIIAIPSADRNTRKELIDICKDLNCNLKIIPGIYQIINGEVEMAKLRKVNIEDLLGREAINIKDEDVSEYISGKTVLVTGGGGSIGSELCRQIAANNPKHLIIVDIYENTTYEIQRELLDNNPDLRLDVLIASVRNAERINSIFEMYKPQIVIHAAAHKHVPLMEDSPNEAIKNNVFGTYEVCKAADKYNAEKFILISTDKAVNPMNIMGASKRMCEMLIQYFNNRSTTDYAAVRFGNVLGSNGSVIPLFKKQIENGGPVTVTHPDIIRLYINSFEVFSIPSSSIRSSSYSFSPSLSITFENVTPKSS